MTAARQAGMAVLAVLTVGVAAVGARYVADGSPPRDGGGGPAVVQVDARGHGPVVPRSFLGLSVEWDSVLPYTGGARGRRGDLVRVLAPVARAAGAPLALRIGGDTGDQAWWNPAGRPRPASVLQDVGPATLGAVAWLARGLGGPVTLGLNLALRDPANAAAMAAQARRRLPPGALAAVEIGNEPDLYRHGHTFRRGGHLHRRLAKDPHYTVAAYEREVQRYLLRLAGRDGPRLVVGGFAGPGWWPSLPGLLRRWGRRPGGVAVHLYALPQCSAPTPSADWLMSTAASGDRVAGLAPLAAIARQRGLPLRVSELNSAACGGRSGLSDTHAAALWLADTLFAILRLGVAGADVHTWRGAAYAPFAVAGAHIVARPPLAGMLAFARTAPRGSRLVAATVHGGGDDGVRAWATVDARGTRRVALLAPRAARVDIAAAGASAGGCAPLWRSPAMPGRPRCACAAAGRYPVRLAARSLAVLTIGATAGGSCSPAERRS
ncbi:MAG TPA: hypothetical protein VGO71_00730 [Baekduia sp.]|nr:hypothetical protein [Baekduia sp.]